MQPVSIEPIGEIRRGSEGETEIALAAGAWERIAELPAETRLLITWAHAQPDGAGLAVARAELVRTQEHSVTVRGLKAVPGAPVLRIEADLSGADLDRVLALWGRVHNTMLTRLEDRLGADQVQALLYTAMRDGGRESAETPRASAAEIGREIMALEALWRIRGGVPNGSADHFVREVAECPWAYFAPISCQTLAWWMEGFCQGSNPACRYALSALMPEGAPVCRWEIHR